MKVRFDRNVVVLFNERNGTKLRLGIGRYSKASKPELVDIKITDFCPFGCTFCYQNSTVQGLHASLWNMGWLVHRLQQAKVFEVAIGGGEPTMHPHFAGILRNFHRNGIVPNFTTKNHTWVRQNWDRIEPYIGAFAYSAQTLHELTVAMRHFENIPKERINIHYIMGLNTQVEFEAFMRRAHRLGVRVTLLGYKTVGRGGQVDHQSYDWFLKAVGNLIKDDTCPTFSIDTPLAAEFDDRLQAGGMPKYMYHTREGAFSMYIDAVAMKMGASSFENLDELMPFDEHWRERYKAL